MGGTDRSAIRNLLEAIDFIVRLAGHRPLGST